MHVCALQVTIAPPRPRPSHLQAKAVVNVVDLHLALSTIHRKDVQAGDAAQPSLRDGLIDEAAAQQRAFLLRGDEAGKTIRAVSRMHWSGNQGRQAADTLVRQLVRHVGRKALQQRAEYSTYGLYRITFDPLPTCPHFWQGRFAPSWRSTTKI